MVKMWCLENATPSSFFVIFGSSRSASASSSFVGRIARKWECCMFVRSRAQIAVIAGFCAIFNSIFFIIVLRQDPLLLRNPPQPPQDNRL
jgi:hypothetical protein